MGGFFDGIIVQNYATAYIDDLAVVSAVNDITVKADTTVNLITIVMAGGYAEKTSIDGAFIYDRVENASMAYIEDRAFVDAGGDLDLDAQSDVMAITITPAISIGGQYGVGIGAAIAHIMDTTQAFIGDFKDTVPIAGFGDGTLTGTVTVGGDLSIYARSTPEIWTVGASAGIALGASDQPDPGKTDNGAMEEDGPNPTPTSTESGQEFGLGFSGSMAFNWIEQNTQAAIRDKVTVNVTGDVSLEAYSDLLLVAVAGGVAFGNDWGIGGAYAHNNLHQTTKAFVENGTIDANDLDIRAHSDNKIIGVAASGAGATDDGAIAGGVNLNFLTYNVYAYIGDGATVNSADISVKAENKNLLVSVAGVLAIGVNGAFAAGADVGLTFVDSTVYAYVGGMAEVTGTDLKVFASDDLEVVSVAAALAVSSDGIGGSGSAASVNLDQDVRAFVTDRKWAAFLAVMDRNADGQIGEEEYLANVADPWIAGGVFALADTNHDGYLSEAEYLAKQSALNTETIGKIDLAGSLYLDADDKTNLIVVAGAVGGGDDAGIGISVANVNVPSRTVKAYIGRDAKVDAKGNGAGIADPGGKLLNGQPFGGRGIRLDATTKDSFLVFAGGGAGADTFAGAGSAMVITMGTTEDTTEAYIGVGARVNLDNDNILAPANSNQSVGLRAEDDTFILGIAGSIAGASTAALGLAANVETITKNVSAHIDSSANVFAKKDVLVQAISTEDILAIAAAGAYGGSAGIVGSASVLDIDTTTSAYIAGTAIGAARTEVDAGGDVKIGANDAFSAIMIAGSVGASSSAGVGAANTTLIHTDTVEAYVGERAIVATAGATGLTVTADSSEDIISIAVAGSGAGTAAVSGSAVVNVLDETTRAYMGRNAILTADNGAAPGAPGISVQAADDTTIVSVAGSLAGAGTAAVGLGADVGTITKRTTAYIDSNVTADAEGDITVVATSSEDITSVAAGVSASGSASVALDASVHVFDIKTLAFIGDDPTDGVASAGAGDVHAKGGVVISADDKTEVDKVVGVLAVATYAGVGAAGGVTIIDKTTEAFIGAGAHVTADGDDTLTGVTINTGAFTYGLATASTFDPNNASGEGIEAGTSDPLHSDTTAMSQEGEVNVPSLDAMDVDQEGGNDVGGGSFDGQRTADPGTKTGFHGVAVTATNRDDIESFTISLAGGVAGIAISATINVVDTDTRAYIGSGAQLNADTSGASDSQSVHIAAGNDFYHLAVAGTLAGGVVGVSPAADVTVLDNTTEAYIGSGASTLVKAKDDITVEAHAREDILLIAFGIAGGVVGIGGAVNVLTIDNTTTAYIGEMPM